MLERKLHPVVMVITARRPVEQPPRLGIVVFDSDKGSQQQASQARERHSGDACVIRGLMRSMVDGCRLLRGKANLSHWRRPVAGLWPASLPNGGVTERKKAPERRCYGAGAVFACGVMVAGAGFEPAAFRL